MKNFLLAIAIFAGVTLSAQTTPRFGTTPSKDNTGRVLTFAFTSTVDAATKDTIYFEPNAFETIWRPSANITDSCIVKFSSTITNYRVGDSFTMFIAKGTGAGRIRFGGSKFWTTTAASTGIALVADKKLYFQLRWDGTKWCETARAVEP